MQQIHVLDSKDSRTRIKFGEQGLSYEGPSAWNSLPDHAEHDDHHNIEVARL